MSIILQGLYAESSRKYETMKCSVKGCGEGAKSKGKCMKCYQKERRANRAEKRKNVI